MFLCIKPKIEHKESCNDKGFGVLQFAQRYIKSLQSLEMQLAQGYIKGPHSPKMQSAFVEQFSSSDYNSVNNLVSSQV